MPVGSISMPSLLFFSQEFRRAIFADMEAPAATLRSIGVGQGVGELYCNIHFAFFRHLPVKWTGGISKERQPVQRAPYPDGTLLSLICRQMPLLLESDDNSLQAIATPFFHVLCIFRSSTFGPKHRPIMGRVRPREMKIGGHKRGQWILRAFLKRTLQCEQQHTKTLSRDNGEQFAAIAKVGIERAVANADHPREIAKGELGRLLVAKHLKRGGDDRISQVAMVIGPVGRRFRQSGGT